MHRIGKLLSVLLLAVYAFAGIACSHASDRTDQQLKRQTVRQLKKRLAEIDRQLPLLAQLSLRSGVGAIGYRSQTHDDAAHWEWIQIDLEKEFAIDNVVLVPCILREAKSGFTAEGFPIEFRVVVGTGEGDDGHEISSFTGDDTLLPRVAPVVISANGARGSWVRVEARLLSPRRFDGKCLFQLAEILIFSDQQNVALRQRVTSSSNEPSGSPAWDAPFVVDGFMPYLMNRPTGTGSLAYVSKVGIGNQPTITIDLQAVQPISQINLHLVDQSDTVPQTFSGDFGIPRKIRIEGANQAEFSDAKLIVELEHESIFDTGPIMIRRFPETSHRYIRLTAIDPYIYSFGEQHGTRIGFAEIELLHNGQNVAHRKPVQVEFETERSRRLEALTDGHNYYGQILRVRRWLSELATRHDLETERPLVAAELNDRYVRQRTILTRLIGLAILIAVAALVVGWVVRQRAVTETRERIAADLHDELGANFHAIGLLSDLVQTNSDSPEKLRPFLERMRDLTERTGTAAIYCANMLESKGLYDDLVEDMRRSSARIMSDLNHEIAFEGIEHLDVLHPRKRIDLFLFHKECLINIIRHSGATHANTRLTATKRGVCLDVTDNGSGFGDTTANGVPPSLRRRARLLGGSATVTRSDDGGTRVSLRLPLRRFGFSYWLGIVRGNES